MPVSRQNDIGLAGRGPGAGVQAPVNGSPGRQRDAAASSDPYLRQYVVELPLVASAAEQALAFVMPTHAISVTGFVRTRVASTAGTTPQVNVGIGGDPTVLASGVSTASIANVGITAGVNLSGLTLAYSFGSADIASWEGELVLTVVASDT